MKYELAVFAFAALLVFALQAGTAKAVVMPFDGNGSNSSLPDLTVTSISENYTNTISCLGNGTRAVKIVFSVENIGNATAYNFTDYLHVYNLGSYEWYYNVDSLAPGNSVQHSAMKCIAAGNWTALAETDFYNTVQESNEGNNFATLNFNV